VFAYGLGDAAASQNLAALKSQMVLLFWYWFTQVILKKRP